MTSNILLASRVIAGGLMLHSQVGAPEIQSAVSKESVRGAQSYLERGEALSATSAYPAAIAAYSTAIQLKPDFAEAYNDRGFAYYLSGNVSGHWIAELETANAHLPSKSFVLFGEPEIGRRRVNLRQ